LQVIRDRMMLRLIFLIPIVQLLVLGYAISTDVDDIKTAVYDFDRSELSREYVRSLTAGDYFLTVPSEYCLLDADRGFRENGFKAVMIIPQGFSDKLEKMTRTDVGFIVDGTNANSAAVTLGYANVMSSRFNERITGFSAPVKIRQKVLYNPEAKSVNFMVPGIVATLVTMIAIMLTSMAIVREREIGTFEQLMVTPISTPALILGKTIPFALLAFLEMSLALLFGILWFNIPFVGSWGLLYLLSFVYLFTTLGLGMFISTITKTQQQAMFFSWFFVIFAILTSGFFIPISNMPQAVQYITYLNPLRYFMKIVRAIIMKGASYEVLYPEILAMLIFGLSIFSLAWVRFSKRVK
ncbi:MAG: ABC transporter permease, partial [Candidatus Zixiibacteriota bacterium]